MSKRLLNQLLDEAIEIIEEDIRDELNLQETTITFTPWIIQDAVLRQLRFTYIRNPKGGKQTRTAKFESWKVLTPQQKELVKKKINTDSEAIMGRLLEEFKNLNPKNVSVVVRGNKRRFTVTTLVENPRDLEKVWRGKNLVAIDAFQSIKEGYRDLMNKLWADIGKYVQELSGISEGSKFKKTAFNLEHKLGESIAERRVGRGISELYNRVRAQVGSDKKATQVFKELGLEVYLKYISTAEKTTVEVFAGSASKNKRQSIKEKELITKVKGSIATAIATKLARGSKIPSWSGSDDRIQIEKKKVVDTFYDSLATKRKKKINTNLNLSKTTSTKKTVKKKVKNKPIRKKPVSVLAKERIIQTKSRQRNSAESYISLQALLNAKITKQVLVNMKEPALRNRTGRFARSVRITDVTPTPQGFPSVGYTYQKEPYQVFERGYKQGSEERDPRKLIDKSIREIALEYITGRFFTRRV